MLCKTFIWKQNFTFKWNKQLIKDSNHFQVVCNAFKKFTIVQVKQKVYLKWKKPFLSLTKLEAYLQGVQILFHVQWFRAGTYFSKNFGDCLDF